MILKQTLPELVSVERPSAVDILEKSFRMKTSESAPESVHAPKHSCGCCSDLRSLRLEVG